MWTPSTNESAELTRGRGGTLVNSLFWDFYTFFPLVQTEYCDRRLAGTGSRYPAPFSLVKFSPLIHVEILRRKDFKSIKLNHCGHCIMISIAPRVISCTLYTFPFLCPLRYFEDFSLRYSCRAGLFGSSLDCALKSPPLSLCPHYYAVGYGQSEWN
jgi:hypothetical protein